MARILYGLSSVGIGHAVRSKVIINELIKKHDLRIITSGYAYKYLKKYYKNKVINIEGLELAFVNNKIANVETILTNMKKVSLKNYLNFLDVMKKLKKFNPKYVISDWETFSSFYAFENYMPLISVGNAHYLAYGKYNVRLKDVTDFFKFRVFLKTLIFPARYYLVNCLPGMKIKKRRNVFEVGPVIREEIIKIRPKKRNYVFVYQSTSSYKELINVLKKVDEKFVIYGFGINKKEKNLHFKSFDDSKKFIKDLAECKAVISNGGFTLISEAMYLKKPVLIVPIKHHFEQTVNAIHVNENGCGEIVREITVSNVKGFLHKKYKTVNFNSGNKKMFKILEGILK